MRSSGDVSMRNVPSDVRTATPVRVRLFLGSDDAQTGQWQPMIGTPWLVPVPRSTSSRLEMIEEDITCKSRMGSCSQIIHEMIVKYLLVGGSVSSVASERSREDRALEANGFVTRA